MYAIGKSRPLLHDTKAKSGWSAVHMDAVLAMAHLPCSCQRCIGKNCQHSHVGVQQWRRLCCGFLWEAWGFRCGIPVDPPATELPSLGASHSSCMNCMSAKQSSKPHLYLTSTLLSTGEAAAPSQRMFHTVRSRTTEAVQGRYMAFKQCIAISTSGSLSTTIQSSS